MMKVGKIGATTFRKPKRMLYTREKYIRGHMDSQIVKFSMGKRIDEPVPEVSLRSNSKIQVRSTAIEAARISLTKDLDQGLSPEGYYGRVCVQAHVITRKRRQVFGPQSDRFGQAKEYGSPSEKVVLLRPGQKIFQVYVPETHVGMAREALLSAAKKLPSTYTVTVEKPLMIGETPAARGSS